jgi:predicted DNA-binding transcriptional regulator YafY
MANGRTPSRIREALKSMRVCSFDYSGPAGGIARAKRVAPHGMFFGRA